jgi:GAF domain-containing protein
VLSGGRDWLADAERLLGEHHRAFEDRLTEVCAVATEAMGVERAWICCVEGDVIRTLGGVAMVLADPRHPPLPVEKGVCGRAVRQMKPQRVDDIFVDHDYTAATALTRSELAVPILAGGQVIGLINFEANRRAAFGDADQRAVESLARLLAPYLESA